MEWEEEMRAAASHYPSYEDDSEEETPAAASSSTVQTQDADDDTSEELQADLDDIFASVGRVDSQDGAGFSPPVQVNQGWTEKSREEKKGLISVVLERRRRNGRVETISCTCKKTRGELIPKFIRSRGWGSLQRRYEKDGETYKRKDPLHQFPAIFDQYMMELGTYRNGVKKASHVDLTQPYCLLELPIVDLEWTRVNKDGETIVLLSLSSAIIKYCFVGHMPDALGKPLGLWYHRFIHPPAGSE